MACTVSGLLHCSFCRAPAGGGCHVKVLGIARKPIFYHKEMQPVRYLCRILLYNCLLLSVCDQSWRLHKASEQANWRLSHSNLALAYLVTLQVATKDGLIL